MSDPRRAAAGKPVVDPELTDRLTARVVSVTAPWWRGERISPKGLVHGLNVAGRRPPLFWCFQGHQEFEALARALGPEQPLYGMRSGHLVIAHTQRHYLHLALAYAQEIQSLAPPGPVLLGGNCQGAMLMQKTAQALMLLERPVALLALLNPLSAAPYAGRAATIVGQHDVTNPMLRFHDGAATWGAHYPRGSVDVLQSKHGELFQEPVLSALVAALTSRIDEALREPVPGALAEYAAQIIAPAQQRVNAGAGFALAVTVRNLSRLPWGPMPPSGLWLANHWRDAEGRALRWLDRRSPMPAIAAGAEAPVTLSLQAPDRAGDYLLDVDVEQPGVGWFSEMGVPCGTCRVAVDESIPP